MSIFSPLCFGLACISKQNIVHRDLKPTNIRVRPNGSPVIIDFGVARLLDMPDLTLTSEGASIGTPLYFAPEQFNGTKHDIDHRTDLFALGVLIFQAATGVHPFFELGMNYSQLKASVTTSDSFLEFPGFKNLPSNWRLIIGRLLEKDRSRRPYDAGQVATILTKLGDQL